MSKSIVFTGGGSAGHCTPNLAIMPVFEKDGYDISYIGTKDGIEREIITGKKIKYYAVSAGKLRRYFSFKNFTDPIRILRGYFQCKKILKRIRPNLVFSKGGFVSVPVVFAAHKLGLPVVLHESDYTPGLANKLCIPRADKICVSFEAAASHIPTGKCVVTGSPVRQELFSGSKEKGLSLLRFDGQKPVLLVMGGSLGAQSVNELVDQILPELLKTFDIIHIRGAGKLNPDLNGAAGYAQFEYVTDELPDIFAAADMMLSRAGANAVFEILALGIPALLIPLPLEASRGDQILNAGYFKKKGYSLVLPQNEATPERLLSELLALKQSAPGLRRNMLESPSANGTQNVINVMVSVLERKK